jgi:hypothetical protein
MVGDRSVAHRANVAKKAASANGMSQNPNWEAGRLPSGAVPKPTETLIWNDLKVGDWKMSGWNRLFVVIAVLWAIAAPLILAHVTNEPVHKTFDQCGDAAYRNYGSGNSRIRLDMDRYHQEVDRCLASLSRDFVSIPKIGSAMIGMGDRTLVLVIWGFILIPLALLWGVSWTISRVVRWVAAGFRR